MFITKTKAGCRSCKKQVVNDIGLGEDNSEIDKEYRGESATGQMLKGGAMQAAQMMSPGGQLLKMIPGMKTDEDPTGALLAPFTYGASMIPGMIPSTVMDPMKSTASKVGIDMNPAAMALTFIPAVGMVALLPGVSQIIGKISNMFGGMFKKATHMGDCMKWFNNVDNIRRKGEGVQPYPIEQVFSFEEYMMKNFPQFLRQYQIMQAGGQWASVGVEAYLTKVKHETSIYVRRQKIQDIFVRLVQENSQIMQLQCAVQHSGESGYTGHTQAQVDEIWNSLKEAARQEEYHTTNKLIDNIPVRIDALVAPFKVKETWGAIVKSRNANLIIPTEHGSQLRMPDNVIGVSRGALVMTLKTPQGQPTPIRK